MIKVTGVDGLARQLEELSKAIAGLDGQIARVEFDPHDLASVERAVQHMEAAIDEKVSAYQGNATVVSIVAQLKERYRRTILDRAAAARLSGGEE